MNLPSIKIKSSKTKMGISSILTILLTIILLGEVYYAFNYVYKNFFTNSAPLQEDKVVRLDTQTYRNTINFLDGLYFFTPNNPTPTNSNPFK